MIVLKKVVLVLMQLVFIIGLLPAQAKEVVLKTADVDEAVAIRCFVPDAGGHYFLYSPRLSKILEFGGDGVFLKSFCRKGNGPGELTRVLTMHFSPVSQCFYLPEFYSGSKGGITIYGTDGAYKGLLKLELSHKEMDRVSHLLFYKDGSYIAAVDNRVGWKPHGKYFLTEEETTIKHFNSQGKMQKEIHRWTSFGELSDKVRWGGPTLFFRPWPLLKLTPKEEIAKVINDSNTITLFDRKGAKTRTITLQLERKKITGKEFETKKAESVEFFKTRSKPRMLELAKNMIKLEYKPIMWDIFLEDKFIAARTDAEKGNQEQIIYFDWNGKRIGSELVDGQVMNLSGGKVYIKFEDSDENELFKIRDCQFRPSR